MRHDIVGQVEKAFCVVVVVDAEVGKNLRRAVGEARSDLVKVMMSNQTRQIVGGFP